MRYPKNPSSRLHSGYYFQIDAAWFLTVKLLHLFDKYSFTSAKDPYSTKRIAKALIYLIHCYNLTNVLNYTNVMYILTKRFKTIQLLAKDIYFDPNLVVYLADKNYMLIIKNKQLILNHPGWKRLSNFITTCDEKKIQVNILVHPLIEKLSELKLNLINVNEYLDLIFKIFDEVHIFSNKKHVRILFSCYNGIKSFYYIDDKTEFTKT
jgi:hypothetical protein